MTDVVGNVLDRKEIRAYVRFERKPVHDKVASLRENRFIAHDVDYVYITPPYSKDVHIEKVVEWWPKLEQKADAGRIPRDWVAKYKEQYRLWQNGQEMPLQGVPIKGWAVISPAQQEMLVRVGIRTVEDLSTVNDEGVHRIGMGAIDLKRKAIAWLKQATDKGPMTIEMARLQGENELLKANEAANAEKLATLQRQVSALMLQAGANAQVPTIAPAPPPPVRRDPIGAEDIMADGPEAPAPETI